MEHIWVLFSNVNLLVANVCVFAWMVFDDVGSSECAWLLSIGHGGISHRLGAVSTFECWAEFSVSIKRKRHSTSEQGILKYWGHKRNHEINICNRTCVFHDGINRMITQQNDYPTEQSHRNGIILLLESFPLILS